MMTNNEHIERLESLAVELDKAMAFLDPPTPGETYWQELDAVSIRAGATALDEVAALRADEKMHVEVIGDLMAETTTLKAEIEQLREANRWRPIAKAPKDNAGIEAIDSRTGFVRVVDYYAGYAPNWNPCWMLQGASNEAYPLDYFTHYRQIPNPPEA